jgi:hypothetical protein
MTERTAYATLDDRLLLVSTDGTGGLTASDRLVGHDFESVAASPAAPDRAFAGTVESGIQRTTDGGDSWDPLPPLTDLPSSSTWSFPPRPHTHHARWLEPDPRDPARLFVAIEAGGLVRTEDSGETWVDTPAGARMDNHTLATHPDAPGRVYAAAGDGYAQSEDAAATWATPQTGLDHRYVWGMAVPQSDPGTVVVSAASGPRSAHTVSTAEAYVYRTTDADRAGDGGVEWSLAMDGLPDRGVYRSDDAGERWERLAIQWPGEYESRTPRGLAVVRD